MAKSPGKPKSCFVVGPIGDDDSDDRIHADWLLEEIIQPVFDEHFQHFTVQRADMISNPGRIDEQVITALLTADLVIADLTTLNPNAFYEIGIRHTIQKPIIHMHLEGQRIPFDISSFRSIKFSRKKPKDLRAAREQLKSFVETVVADDYVVDNPVTFSRGKVEFAKSATSTEKVLLDEIEMLGRRIEKIESAGPVSVPAAVKGSYFIPHLVVREEDINKNRKLKLRIRRGRNLSVADFEKLIIENIRNKYPAYYTESISDDDYVIELTKGAITENDEVRFRELSKRYDVEITIER